MFVAFLCSAITLAQAIEPSQFEELLGYTVVACTSATGELDGADYDKLVQLDNGMTFEFHTYSYFYEYHPDVAVFAKEIKLGGKSVIVYKLVIEDQDEIFDVTRIR